jgi:hypothetical protein
MISKIMFDNKIVIEREEAEKLNLDYSSIKRIGIKDSTIQSLASYEVIKNIDAFYNEEKAAWFTKEGEKQSSHYLYDPLPEHLAKVDWVELEREQLVDLTIFLPICKYPFRVIKTVTDSSSPNVLPIILNDLNKKLLDTISSIEVLKETSFNSKCEVHMGGGLLLTINELKLIEDSCTDALQHELDNGWRIVSVNVQPNQRRSDYILGRYNPKKGE